MRPYKSKLSENRKRKRRHVQYGLCLIVLTNCVAITCAEQQKERREAGSPAPQLRDFEEAVGQMHIVSRQDGLERVWRTDGNWWSVANDQNSGLIYALAPKGKCAELDPSGKVLREFELGESKGLTLRVGQLTDEGRSSQLLTFGKWVGQLQAYDLSGNLRWSHRSGINDVWPIDLNGNGADEVIIGFNGGGGLHVLTSEGTLLWQADGSNLWQVSASDVLGMGVPQVLTTASGGKVHIFGRGGRKIKMLDPGFYVTLVRGTSGSDIVVGGKLTLASLSGDGTKNWSMQLPFRGPTTIKEIQPNIHSAQVAIEQPWLAIAGDWGDVCVVDLATGDIVGHVNGQGRPTVCWTKAETRGESLLVVASGKAVNAFRVTK